MASAKSGTVYEKRLIEAYIDEHGKEPSTGEELTKDDLIELKSKNLALNYQIQGILTVWPSCEDR